MPRASRSQSCNLVRLQKIVIVVRNMDPIICRHVMKLSQMTLIILPRSQHHSACTFQKQPARASKHSRIHSRHKVIIINMLPVIAIPHFASEDQLQSYLDCQMTREERLSRLALDLTGYKKCVPGRTPGFPSSLSALLNTSSSLGI